MRQSRAPQYAKAQAMRAWSETISPWVSRSLDLERVMEAGARAEEILDSLETDAEDEAYAGYTLAFSGLDPARGLRLVERTTERCPSFAWAWTSGAMLNAFMGESEAAVARANQALRLSPNDPMAFRSHMALCFAHVASGDYQAMLDHAHQGLELNPRAIILLRLQTVALAHLGRLDEARESARRHMELAPGFRIQHYTDTANHLAVMATEVITQPLVEGLRLAGVPE